MKLCIRCLLFTIALATPLTAQAENSMLRIMCEGKDIGAEVSINGKFKGECPIDMQVAPGKLKLRVVKPVDAENELLYEQEVRIGDGVVKKVEVVLSPSLTAEGEKRIGAEIGFTFYKDVVQDTRTGLMWARNGNIAGEKKWDDAMKWVKTLNIGGYRDWRLPTKEELLAFAQRGGNNASEWFNANGFHSVQSTDYWSGSGSADRTYVAWFVALRQVEVSEVGKTLSLYVWPVRSGQF